MLTRSVNSEMRKVIGQINQHGVSILLVEQNVQLSLEIADFAYIIELGNIANEGLAEELHEEVGIDPSTRAQLTTIRDSASRASTIVTDLLKFARQSTPEMQRRDMRETVQSSLRLTEYLTRKGKIEVAVELPDQPVMMAFDAQQIEQVLSNLVTNAYQAMPDGGQLSINSQAHNDEVIVAVSDTGYGIPPENMNRLFEPLFTTKAKGIGLGLAVSKNLLEANGGSIEVESEAGKGSTFTITLPLESRKKVK